MSPTYTDDDIFFRRLLELSVCVSEQWTAANLPTPCFLGIVPGDFMPSDYCQCNENGACGQVWVRLQLVTEQSSLLGDTGQLGNSCVTPLLAQVEVGHLACVPGVGEDGSLPSVSEQLDAARAQYAAMAALARAIRCCYASKKDIGSLSYLPYGPAGGCVGGAWTFTMAGD